MPILLHSQSVGLVLSGGGAKGLSHIGVLKALEENNIPIDYVAGTSIGAIVGGLYSIGLSPDEMIYLFKSEEFKYWYKGNFEEEYATYLYKDEPTPSMITVNLYLKQLKNNKKKVSFAMPTSLVSPYPMDIAVVQLFASSSAACGNDFDKLMLPFFCMAADIKNKQPYLAEKGDLGSAIRASMTFPGYFKPILIDSTLMFDGGFYNNFPWKEMKDKYNPDYIIGVKCALGKPNNPSEFEPLEQIQSMITKDTDYNIPDEEGILINGLYDYGLMDFDKIDELVQLGYNNALEKIPEIKEKIRREKNDKERIKERLEFRKKCPELKFSDVNITGNVNSEDKAFIRGLVTQGDSTLSFDQAKRGYYRVIASGFVHSVSPTASYKSDSTFVLNLRSTKKSKLGMSIGGNISSSSLTQGYLGLSYKYLCRYPIRLNFDFDIGQFYTGGRLLFRQDFRFKQMFFYELELNTHRFNYFTSNQSLLYSSALASNVIENETYGTLNIATTISKRYNLLLEAGFTMGVNIYDYFKDNSYSKYDKKDHTNIKYITPRLMIKQSTLDYPIYPTSGKNTKLQARYIHSNEDHIPGTLSSPDLVINKRKKDSYQLRFKLEEYYSLASWFSLGYQVDLSYSTKLDMGDYTSTLLMTPAFQPFVHSKTILVGSYRAPVFAGVAITPVFKFIPSLYIHLTAAYFQPYESILDNGGGKYSYSDTFPIGQFMANAALVWQSPVGPISFSCAYYDKGETKWYPQFNIGFLIFRDRGLRN